MKNLLSIILVVILACVFTIESAEAQTSRTRESTVIRASQIMLDTLTNADTISYTFPGRANPFTCEVKMAWTSISGTCRDTVTIYTQGEPAVRLNTTNTTTGTTLQGADYTQKYQFVIGATGLIGGVKDTTFTFSLNGAANLKFYHKSTGTQSTRVKTHAKIYVATNERTGTAIN